MDLRFGNDKCFRPSVHECGSDFCDSSEISRPEGAVGSETGKSRKNVLCTLGQTFFQQGRVQFSFQTTPFQDTPGQNSDSTLTQCEGHAGGMPIQFPLQTVTPLVCQRWFDKYSEFASPCVNVIAVVWCGGLRSVLSWQGRGSATTTTTLADSTKPLSRAASKSNVILVFFDRVKSNFWQKCHLNPLCLTTQECYLMRNAAEKHDTRIEGEVCPSRPNQFISYSCARRKVQGRGGVSAYTKGLVEPQPMETQMFGPCVPNTSWRQAK